MNDDEILEILEDTCGDEVIFNFLRELFLLEVSGTVDWSKTYDMIINEYIEKI